MGAPAVSGPALWDRVAWVGFDITGYPISSVKGVAPFTVAPFTAHTLGNGFHQLYADNLRQAVRLTQPLSNPLPKMN